MKKIIIVLTILLLTACNSDSNLTNIDIHASSIKIDEKIGNVSDINKDELKDLYGVDTSLIKEYVFKISNTSDGHLYAILHVESDNKTEVKNQMDKYFELLENQNEMYSPEAVNKIKNRLETSVGDYLIYIVSEDNNEIYNIIKENIK